MDKCVSAWLYDLRSMTSSECTAILTSKSIACPPGSSGPENQYMTQYHTRPVPGSARNSQNLEHSSNRSLLNFPGYSPGQKSRSGSPYVRSLGRSMTSFRDANNESIYCDPKELEFTGTPIFFGSVDHHQESSKLSRNGRRRNFARSSPHPSHPPPVPPKPSKPLLDAAYAASRSDSGVLDLTSNISVSSASGSGASGSQIGSGPPNPGGYPATLHSTHYSEQVSNDSACGSSPSCSPSQRDEGYSPSPPPPRDALSSCPKSKTQSFHTCEKMPVVSSRPSSTLLTKTGFDGADSPNSENDLRRRLAEVPHQSYTRNAIPNQSNESALLLPFYLNCKGLTAQFLQESGKMSQFLSPFSANRELTKKFLEQVLLYMDRTEWLEPYNHTKWKDNIALSRSLEAVKKQRLSCDSSTIGNLQTELRRCMHDRLKVVAKIILQFLSKQPVPSSACESALTQFGHCGLFGDDIAIYLVQIGSISVLMRYVKDGQSEAHVQKQALRCLSVLCSTQTGCHQFLQQNGVEVITAIILSPANPRVSVEASGVLAQVTAPCSAVKVTLKDIPKLVARLLQLCSNSQSQDSFLLCSAALANLAVQHSSVSDCLYTNNAVRCMAHCLSRDFVLSSHFAQEQIATILCRLSASHYEEALIAQGAVPVLLKLLQVPGESDLQKRIRSKAAIALANIAATGYGLKVLAKHSGCSIISQVYNITPVQQGPVHYICRSLLTKLSSAEQLVTMV